MGLWEALLLTVCLSLCETQIVCSPSLPLLADMSVLVTVSVAQRPSCLVSLHLGRGPGMAVGPLTHTACPGLLPQAGMGEEDFPLGSTSDAAIPLCFEFFCTGVTNVCSVSAPFPPLQQLV